jgi:DNA-binding transcriptional MerR regulator
MSADNATEPPDQDGLYPIRTVSALTGVNPVTLRAWERRYGLIEPQRTPKGHRLYTEGDIERIHRILELLDQGISIGQTRRLIETDAPVQEASLLQGRDEDAWSPLQRRISDAVDRLDEAALSSAYDDALACHPVSRVHRQLVLPLSRELASRDHDDAMSLAARRFFSAFMRNKLGAQIHHQSDIARGPKILAACLPGEGIETELMLFGVTALGQGYRLVLLGPDTPVNVAVAASRQCHARGVALFGEPDADTRALEEPLRGAVAEASGPVFVGGGIADSERARIEARGATPLPSDSHDAVRRVQQGLLR